jgi:hypothetical protein
MLNMRGDLVIVRAYGDEALVRRVWEENSNAVFITDDTNLKLLLSGSDALQPIGFPKEDVFKYDQMVANTIKNNKCDWSRLKPWTGKL